MALLRLAASGLLTLLVAALSLLVMRYVDVRDAVRQRGPHEMSMRERVGYLKRAKLTCADHAELCGAPMFAQAPPIPMPHRLGRWKRSPHFLELPALQAYSPLEHRIWGHATLKRWSYVSMSSPRYFVGTYLLRFAYVSDVMLYVVDRQDNNKLRMYTSRMPLGMGVNFAASPTAGCTVWGEPTKELSRESKPFIEMCARSLGDGGFRVRASVPVDKAPPTSRIMLDLTMEGPGVDSLTIEFPLGGDEHRPQFIHKGAGQAISAGWISIDDGPKYDCAPEGSMGIDWTMGHALMRTQWRWVSLNDAKATVKLLQSQGQAETRTERFGINLSEFVYDVVANVQGNDYAVSAENAVWLNGQVVPLHNPIAISPPTDPKDHTTKPWKIKSLVQDPDEFVDLTFYPAGAREDHEDMLVVVSDFVQPYGRFEGTVRVRHPDMSTGVVSVTVSRNAFGVVENHLAVW